MMHHKLFKTFQTTLPHGTIIMTEFGEQFLFLIQKFINKYIDETDDYKVTIGMIINQGRGADIEEKLKKDGVLQTKIRRSSRNRNK